MGENATPESVPTYFFLGGVLNSFSLRNGSAPSSFFSQPLNPRKYFMKNHFIVFSPPLFKKGWSAFFCTLKGRYEREREKGMEYQETKHPSKIRSESIKHKKEGEGVAFFTKTLFSSLLLPRDALE